MIIGYARVSTEDQKTDLQFDALTAAGCTEFYSDKLSGGKFDRPGLNEMLKFARSGDTIVVWKLDRLGRSLKDLVTTIQDLNSKGIHFKSLQENIDTTSPSGKLIFHIFASLAEFERDIIKERTNAGLKAARARGRLGGRPKGLSPQAESTSYAAAALYKEGQLSIKQICQKLSISQRTLYKYLRIREANKL
ncbi:MAG: resolvase [Rickettsiaceae bacterium]|jgi:DNA invertase Pin-like site-specific DNA recombinase|nr:resolvase [Rickettsiaceae bacterium]